MEDFNFKQAANEQNAPSQKPYIRMYLPPYAQDSSLSSQKIILRIRLFFAFIYMRKSVRIG